MRKNKTKIVIIGAGFAGLRIAQKLASANVDITLIDRNNYHLFQPLLYQVAAAYIDPEQIAKPIRQIFRKQKNLSFKRAEVTGMDYTSKSVHTEKMDFDYDYLILAFGGVTNYFGLPGLKEHGFSLKTLEDALLIRTHILSSYENAVLELNPEKRSQLLTVAIGGGGPAGVEMAGALAELIQQVMVKDYKEFTNRDFKLVLCEGSDRILPDLPPDLALNAEKVLIKKGVELRYGSFIKGYDGKTVQFRDKNDLPAATLIWAAGINAGKLSLLNNQETGANNRLKVNDFLQLPDHNDVYVIGDAAYWEEDGNPLPMVAPAAVQMADRAARNILEGLKAKSPLPFHYKSPGALATIGRNAAVAYIGGMKFKGFSAWLVWLVVHLLRLIGFRNRLIVLINWAWDYFFQERASRLILKIKNSNKENEMNTLK
jgi:NADH:quinone reductase (non-electrogenic)